MSRRCYNMLFEADDGAPCMAYWRQGTIIVHVIGKAIQIPLEQMILNPEKKERIAETMKALMHEPFEEKKSWAETQQAKFTLPS